MHLVKPYVSSISASSEGEAYGQTPVEMQLRIFGLTTSKLNDLKGKSVLDVGCGDGDLVRYLRLHGINAKGIDSRAPLNDTNFIRNDIDETHGIPRDNETYELITSFQNPILNFALTDMDKSLRHFENLTDLQRLLICNIFFLKAEAIIYEMTRTIKSDGEILIFPNLPRLEMALTQISHNPVFLSNIPSFHQRQIEVNPLFGYLKWKLQKDEVSEEYMERNNHLTVLKFVRR